VFWHCTVCELVFRDPSQYLTQEAEAARYRTHRNSLDDPRYLDFLDRLAAPMSERLAPGARGLDYGCGPVGGMAALLEPRGFETRSWDPLFHPNDATSTPGAYDFVTCSEVLEHLPLPNTQLDHMASLLRPGGQIGIMTQFRGEIEQFATWHYRRDPTHVCFYSAATMRWIAKQRGWQVELPADGLAFFRILPEAAGAPTFSA
jgi:SAM-dependent methyltransferase